MALGAAVGFWHLHRQARQGEARAIFEHSVDQVRNAVANRLGSYEAILRGAAGFWQNTPEAGRRSWQTYVSALALGETAPGVDALTFTASVTDGEKEDFLKRMRENLQPDFAIRPPGLASDYFVITHIEPEGRTRSALGFDVGSERARRRAAEQARDAGVAQMTEPLRLITTGSTSRDVIVFMPVYRRLFPLAKVEERRRALLGWVGMGIHAESLLRTVIHATASLGLRVEVFAVDANGVAPLYQDVHGAPADPPVFTAERTLRFAGQSWRLDVNSTLDFEASQFADVSVLLGINLAFALALTGGLGLLILWRQQNALLARQALLRLGRAERRLASLVDVSPSVIYACRADRESHFAPTFISQAIRMFGYTPEQVLAGGDGWTENLHPEDRERVLEHIRRLIRQREGGEITYRFRDKTGNWRWVLDRSVVVCDPSGIATEIVGTLVDVSELQKTRQEMDHLNRSLSDSEFRYARLSELTLEGIVLQRDALIVDANTSFCRLVGRARTEVVGQPFTLFVDPEWQAEALNRERDRSDEPYELLLTRRNGTTFAAEVLMRSVVFGGEPVWALAIRDITERKDAETLIKRSGDLLESVRRLQAMFIGDAPAAQVFSMALRDILALTESEFGIMAEVAMISDPDDEPDGSAPCLVHAVAASIETGDGWLLSLDRAVPERMRLDDSTDLRRILIVSGRPVIANDIANDPRSLSLSGTFPAVTAFLGLPLRRGDAVIGAVMLTNRPGGYDWALVDELQPVITAFAQILEAQRNRNRRQQMEEALATKTRELERSNADLQQFAYVASHDLQEPLRMVTSYLQLLERRYAGQLDAKAREFIAFAAEGGRRMSALIKDLLEFSRIESQGRPLQPVTMESVVQEVVAIFSSTLAECGGTLQVISRLPVVMGDDLQLVRLLVNLVGNAIKYRKPDVPPVVRISCRRRGDDWLFAVSDNGIGIAPAYFERVFLVFQRLHTRSRYEGTGIGLAVCKRIVERHGGAIWVESQGEGRGATFLFTLPVRSAEVRPLETQSATNRSAPAASPAALAASAASADSAMAPEKEMTPGTPTDTPEPEPSPPAPADATPPVVAVEQSGV